MTKSLPIHWDAGLSEQETYLIGAIFVHWGALEHEVFMQTLATFDHEAIKAELLPGAMNNLQFTQVLALWKERVVDKATGRRGKSLLRQHDTIIHLKPFRDALAHGMWAWKHTAKMTKITTTRVRKRQVISTTFTANGLRDFSHKLAALNFKIRFPGGLADYVEAVAKSGGSVSRRGANVLSGRA